MNYSGLKATIQKLNTRLVPEGSRIPEGDFKITIKQAQDYFSKRLDDEVEKVVLFFLQQQGSLSGALLGKNMEAEKARDFAPSKAASSAALSDLHTGSVYDPQKFLKLSTLQEADEKSESMPDFSPEQIMLSRNRDRSRSGSTNALYVTRSFHQGMMQLSQRLQNKSSLRLFDLGEQEIDRFHNEYVEIARSLMDLVEFLDINIQGLRKIIKKFEKTLHASIGRDYIIARQSKPLSQLKVLYSNEGVQAIMGGLRRALEELTHARERRALEIGYDKVRQRSVSEIEPVYVKLVKRQQRVELEQSAGIQRLLMERTDMSLELAQHNTDKQQESEEALGMEIQEHFPSYYINLACAFLYNTNLAINGPTCPAYAISLGGTLTMNGVINGMTPFAACISCIAYSHWTNSCFRPSLLASVTFMFVGNILYALARYYNAFWMLCVGRLLLGIGGPHGINRRYIADTVPTIRRTEGSAAFVASAAVGMAGGPFLAALWGQRSFVVWDHVVNEQTAPGWIMVVLWSIYLVCLLIYFREPNFRHGNTAPKASRYNADNEKAAVYEKITVTKAIGSYKSYLNSQSSTPGEKAVLIPHQSKKTRLFPKVPIPVQSLLYFYFVQKYLTEMITQTLPIIAIQGFDYSIQGVGVVMSLIVLPVVPVNIFCGKLSRYVEDRTMLHYGAWMIVAAVILTLDFDFLGVPYTEAQYLFGIFVTFILLQAYEGVLMSLLSRIISPELAQGTMNSGLLATVFGTFGRVVGDFLISFVGYTGSLTLFVNSMFGPALGLLALTLAITLYLYKYYI